VITVRGIALVVGAVLLWLLGRVLGVAELFVVAGATGALVVVSAVSVRLSSASIAVRRTVTAHRLLAGQRAEVALELRSDGRLPSALMLVEDHCDHALTEASTSRFVIPGIGPGRTVAVRYEVRGWYRGRHEIGPLTLRVRDPFGLTERARRYPQTEEVLVYPPVEVLPEGLARGSHHGTETSDSRRLFNAGDEFYTLREYAMGDDLRQVHWPSSAHRGRLMVRQNELPWDADATLFCDTRAGAQRGAGPDSTLEKAVSVTASMLWHLADHHYRLRLLTETATQPPQVEDWETLLDRLAEVAPSRVEQIGPALMGLHGAESGGLFAAALAPPPGDGPCAAHPDLRALLQAGRRFAARVGVVCAAAGPPTARAEEMAGLLAAAGWRTTVVAPRAPLADQWPSVVGGRRPPRAFQPS
jgi:uncharacterized protein (DUF58 family)